MSNISTHRQELSDKNYEYSIRDDVSMLFVTSRNLSANDGDIFPVSGLRYVF